MHRVLEHLFHLRAAKATIRGELLGGLTTFLATAYIMLVNPAILADAGIDPGAAFVATCLVAAAGSALMGLLANYPIAVAPGMGLNAFFAYGVVLGAGVAWQTALGVTFLAALLFVALSLSPTRGWIMQAIPDTLRIAIAAGVGFFLVVIGLTSAELVVDHPVTLVALGDLTRPPCIIAALTFLLIAALDSRNVPGAVLTGMVAATVAGLGLDLVQVNGVVSPPPSLAPTLFALDIPGALDVALFGMVLGFLFVDLFDTSGTLFGIAHEGGFVKRDGGIPRARRVMAADSIASLLSALVGTSPATAYIESTAGIRAGGRTGLVACTVALLFLASLFLAPLATAVPAFATGPALAYVGCRLASVLAHIDWNAKVSTTVPVVVTALAMPLTYSISTGIGLGIICHVALQLASRERSFTAHGRHGACRRVSAEIRPTLRRAGIGSDRRAVQGMAEAVRPAPCTAELMAGQENAGGARRVEVDRFIPIDDSIGLHHAITVPIQAIGGSHIALVQHDHARREGQCVGAVSPLLTLLMNRVTATAWHGLQVQPAGAQGRQQIVPGPWPRLQLVQVELVHGRRILVPREDYRREGKAPARVNLGHDRIEMHVGALVRHRGHDQPAWPALHPRQRPCYVPYAGSVGSLRVATDDHIR
jgi:AGZA family xanthine/uracil permease-like MFS transporter